MIEQTRISEYNSAAAGLRLQYAAICYRLVGSRTQVLMITTRRSGRWIPPRGWPVKGLTPTESAAREAWEEAGVLGRVAPRCLGSYCYSKGRDRDEKPPIFVMAFALQVRKLRRRFPEAGQRRRKWMTPDKAASRVREAELSRMLRGFEPTQLH